MASSRAVVSRDLESFSDDDDSSAEYTDDEDTGLLRKCLQTWESAPHSFQRIFLSALQIAVWCSLMVICAVCVSREDMTEAGLPFATIGCNVLYILQPTIGGTIQSALGGLVGSFLASFMFLFLNVMNPGGITCYYNAYDLGFNVTAEARSASFPHRNTSLPPISPCPDEEHYHVALCVSASAIYVVLMLFLNIDGTVRFFALGNYCFFVMTYLNPAIEYDFSTGTSIKFKGLATNALCLYVISAVLAILMMSFPWCKTSATGRIRAKLHATIDKIFELKQDVLKYASGSVASLHIFEIQAQLRAIDSITEECKDLAASAYFESCCGNPRTWQETSDLVTLIDRIVELFKPLVSIVKDEDFKDSHQYIMSHVHDPLQRAIHSMHGLASSLGNVVLDSTHEDEEIRKDLREATEENKRLVENASHTIRKVAARPGLPLVCPESESEHFMVYTTCATGALARGLANDLVKEEKQPAVSWAPMGKIRSIFQVDRRQAVWASRTFLALLAAFVLGYYGMGNCKRGSKPECAPLVAPFNGDVAFHVVVFMSNGVASTFASALSRISAVVLSTIVGQSLYFFFGWCNVASYVMTVVSTFLVVFVGIYMGFGGGENAAIGTRLSATALAMLWIPCSNEASTYKTYSEYFHGLIDVVFGVFLLTIVDVIFGEEPASAQATKKVKQAMQDYLELLETYMTTDMTMETCVDKAATIKANISSAQALSDAAGREPQWWRMAWQTGTFTVVAESYTTSLSHLCNLAAEVRGRKAEMLQRFGSYSKVARAIIEAAHETNTVCEHVLRSARKKPLLAVTRVSPEDWEKTVEDLRVDMNGYLKTQGVTAFETTQTGDCTATRQCVITVTLKAMMSSHQTAQEHIIASQNL